MSYFKLNYEQLVSKGMNLFLTILIVVAAKQIQSSSLKNLNVDFEHLHFNLTWVIIILITMIALLATFYLNTQKRPIYLVNFSCYKPQDSCKWSKKLLMDNAYAVGKFTEESIEFLKKVLEKSGLGEETYLPEILKTCPLPSLKQTIEGTEGIIHGTLDQLFAKTGVHPMDIGILIVSSSAFNPTPSMSAMIVNHYKMRSDIRSYKFAGMGCSAGLISIDLAKNLLQVHKNSFALIVCVEEGTIGGYLGNDKSMLVSNCVFRMGASAILLSNKKSDRARSKYQLVHTVRTHKGADDKSFSCVTQREDSKGIVGVSLSKELMNVAGDALKANITTLGPLVLPLSEQFRVLVTLIRKKFDKKLKVYVPDFKLAFDHFCIHAGGKAVIDAVEKNLRLSDWHVEPSRMTLYRFGNTSITSVWYELAYTEAKGRVKKGDLTWQIAFGSGFKCVSAVWKALRTVNPSQETNPWMDEIDSFPVNFSKDR